MAYSLLNKIWGCTSITASEKANLLRRCYVGRETEDSVVDIYITNETLAKDTGLSPSTIQRTNASLEKKGLLVNDRPTSKSKNYYRMPKAVFEQPVYKSGIEEKETVTMTVIDSHHDRPETVTMTVKQLYSSSLSKEQLLLFKQTVENFQGDGTTSVQGIERRLDRMRKYGDIRGSAQLCSFEDLVRQVILHVMHRHPMKTRSDLHALNSACKLIKEGRWKEPIIRDSKAVEEPQILVAQEEVVVAELSEAMRIKKQELGRRMMQLSTKLVCSKGLEKEQIHEELRQLILEHSMIGVSDVKVSS